MIYDYVTKDITKWDLVRESLDTTRDKNDLAKLNWIK